jgi:hypothetical protein
MRPTLRIARFSLAAAIALIGEASAEDKNKTTGDTKTTGDKPAATAPKPATGTMTGTTVTAGQIADNPVRFIGQRVTVKAEIEDVLGRQAFTLDEDRLFAYPDVLVIAPGLTGVLPEDTNVTVTGTVQTFNDVNMKRDYAWNWWDDLDTDVSPSYKDRPVIMAESILDKDGRELVKKNEPAVAEPEPRKPASSTPPSSTPPSTQPR